MRYRINEIRLPFYYYFYVEIFDGIGWIKPMYLKGNRLYIKNKFKSIGELKIVMNNLTE